MPEHPIILAAQTLPLCQLEAVIDRKVLAAMHATEEGSAGARRTMQLAELLALHRRAEQIIARRDAELLPAPAEPIRALEIPPLSVTLTPTIPRTGEKQRITLPGRPAAPAAAPLKPLASVPTQWDVLRAELENRDLPTDRGVSYWLGSTFAGWSESLEPADDWQADVVAHFLPFQSRQPRRLTVAESGEKRWSHQGETFAVAA